MQEGVNVGSGDHFNFSEDRNEEDQKNAEIIANEAIRITLDMDLQNLKRCPRSRERSLAITKLQESIMWLGMDLERLNEPNPYPDSYKPENTNIAPITDGMKM